MRITNITNSLSRTIHSIGYLVKDHSPEILAAVGTIGVGVSAVIACKATLKVNDVIIDTKETLGKIHWAMENPEELKEPYTEEDNKKDIILTYLQTAGKVIRLYAPSVIIGTLSITAMLTSNNILRKRNMALVAAYTAVDEGFKKYRNNVIERFGKDVDRDLRFGVKNEVVDETVVDEETGKKKKVKTTVSTFDPNEISQFAVVFDSGCKGWTPDPALNKAFLLQTQNYLNDKLKHDKRLFLNDVYEELGFAKTQAGQIVGWLYDEKCPNGDNCIDFNIWDISNEATRRFLNGLETNILLDFNVDGPIIDKAW